MPFKHTVTPATNRKTLTIEEWKAKAISLFGQDPNNWKFKCRHCGGIQTKADFVAAEVPEPGNKFFFSCIGRWVPGRGCNWTLGGLLQIHETEVINEDGKAVPVFEFAQP